MTVGKAARSRRQPRAVARRVVESPERVLVPADIAIAAQLDLDRVFTKVARGLYWWRHHALPLDDRFIVRLMNARDFRAWSSRLSQPVQKLGAEFWWMTGCDARDVSWSIWLFLILGAIGVGVWYGEATTLDIPRPSGLVLRHDLP